MKKQRFTEKPIVRILRFHYGIQKSNGFTRRSAYRAATDAFVPINGPEFIAYAVRAGLATLEV